MAKKIFQKKNVMVTGGAGFIGSHLCDRLIREAKVICVDNFLSGTEDNINHLLPNPDFEFVKHDIAKPFNIDDYPELEKFHVRFQGIQEIYHLACPHIVRDFLKHTIEVIKANSLGMVNILDLAVQQEAKLVHASSSVVYGPRISNDIYFKEDYQGVVDFSGPRSSYDEGKRFAEAILVNYKNKYNFPFKVARIFRTYGPRMKLNDGQMIPDFIENALDGKSLAIYGDDGFRTTLCYVSDIVDGLVKLMQYEKDLGPVNLGSEQDLRLSDVANKIIEMVNSDSKVELKEQLLFMSSLGLPDISEAKNILGWLPLVNLEQGLKETIDYSKATKSLISIDRMSEVERQFSEYEDDHKLSQNDIS